MTLKENIIKILKEEVNKKFIKPTVDVEKLIQRWLNNYVSGAQIYKIKNYEFSYTFEWCNHNMEIMSFHIEFDYDDDVWSDDRKTEERNFNTGTMYLPKDTFFDLKTFILVRENYLKYFIEEWFEDTLLDEISKSMGRNDIHVSEISIFPEKSQKCVPPMTKDENVTMQDMIDYVLKNTLYNIKDLEKKTDEEIEKIYLEKLRQKEMERLRNN